jgi:glycosyltransferase involved in cell wall biosynthesis
MITDKTAAYAQPNPRLHADTPAQGPIIALIPCYNEERFIASVVIKARRHVDEVIVVDDGSKDETVFVAEAAGATVIRQPHNQGKAAAMNVGFAVARERNPAAVVMIDGDGQHDANEIPALVAPILAGEADVVVGSRFVGSKSNTPGWRVAGQVALNVATNVASGVSITDTQSGYRALGRQALEKFNFRTRGFSIESEMQFLIAQHTLKVAEVPIVVNYDEAPKRNPVKHGLQVLNGIMRMVGQNRPLFFFGVPGLVILVAGLVLGVGVVESYRTFSALAIGTSLIAITLVIVGLFSLFTGIILHTIRAYLAE